MFNEDEQFSVKALTSKLGVPLRSLLAIDKDAALGSPSPTGTRRSLGTTSKAHHGKRYLPKSAAIEKSRLNLSKSTGDIMGSTAGRTEGPGRGRGTKKLKPLSPHAKHMREVQLRRKKLDNEKLHMIERHIENKSKRSIAWKERRQNQDSCREWALTLVLLRATGILGTTLKNYQKKVKEESTENHAATVIQRSHKASYARRMARRFRMASIILRKYEWKARMNQRCLKRKRYAATLRTFLKDFTAQGELVTVMKTFRWKAIKGQRIARSYLFCRRARLHALGLLWDRLERQHGKAIRHHITKRLDAERTEEEKILVEGRKLYSQETSLMRQLQQKTQDVFARAERKMMKLSKTNKNKYQQTAKKEFKMENSAYVPDTAKTISMKHRRVKVTTPFETKLPYLSNILRKHRVLYRKKIARSQSTIRYSVEDARTLLQSSQSAEEKEIEGQQVLPMFILYSRVDHDELLACITEVIARQVELEHGNTREDSAT
eukprot:g4104.t1